MGSDSIGLRLVLGPIESDPIDPIDPARSLQQLWVDWSAFRSVPATR